MVIKDVQTWLNLKYPNLARLQILLLHATELLTLQSLVHPVLYDIERLNNAMLCFIYNLEIYRPEAEITALRDKLLGYENEILTASKKNPPNMNFNRELLIKVREMFPKALAVSHKCGLGLELKTGKIDVQKNI